MEGWERERVRGRERRPDQLDSSRERERGRGFLGNICSAIFLLFHAILRAFRRRNSTESTRDVRDKIKLVPLDGVISIATPNHLPFHGLDMTSFVPPITAHCPQQPETAWRGILQRSQLPPHRPSEVELRDIRPMSDGMSKGKTSTSTTAINSNMAASLSKSSSTAANLMDKPKEIWRRDELLMAQGRYAFDPRFITKYRLKQLLGEGSFGFVWVAERLRDGLEVVVKFILREKVPPANWIFDGELGLVPLEVHIMKIVIHKNIIGFIDYFSDFRFVYLVSELHGTSWTWPNPRLSHDKNIGLRPPAKLQQLSHHTLTQSSDIPSGVLGRRAPYDLFECIEAHIQLPLPVIRHIFRQILDAVLYLYSLGIVHRDIKDENIVVDENYHVKFIDFGSAAFYPTRRGTHSSSSFSANDSHSLTAREAYFDKFNGTVAFAAPEIIRGSRYKPSEAEVWSLGVLLYTMAFRKSPFTSSDAILNGPLHLPHDTEDETGLCALLRMMLQKNPLKRIRIDEIPSHPFLNKG